MNKIKEWKTLAFRPRIGVIFAIIAFLIVLDMSFYAIGQKKHNKYISLPEELMAVRAGDTLWEHNYGDTTIIDLQPSLGAKPIIILPN